MLIARQMLKIVVVAAIAAAFLAPSAIAAEEDASEVTLTGTVAATQDANGVVTAVQLTTADDVVHQVVLNATGKQLGEEMNGKEVEVTGVVFTEGEQQWIRVTSFKAVVEE